MNTKKITLSFLFFLLAAAALTLLTACGSNSADNPSNPSGADLDAGKRTYQANCSSCHSTDKGVMLVGPSLAGLSERAGSTVNGLDGEAYIRQSILEPDAYLNEGFQNLMPSTYTQQLTGEEMDNLVAYLLTLQ